MTGLFPEWLCLRNLSHTATAAAETELRRASSRPMSTPAANARRERSLACAFDAVSVAKSAVKFSCTATSLRLPRRSCISSSAKRNAFRNCDAFCRGTPSRIIRPHSALFLLGCAAYAVRADRGSPRVDLVYIFSSNGALIPQPQRLRSAYLRAHATDRLAGDATRQFRAMPRLSAANDETVLTEPHCGPSALTTSAAPLDRETGAAFRSSWRDDALQVLPHVS
jgi:hypothetical protein